LHLAIFKSSSAYTYTAQSTSISLTKAIRRVVVGSAYICFHLMKNEQVVWFIKRIAEIEDENKLSISPLLTDRKHTPNQRLRSPFSIADSTAAHREQTAAQVRAPAGEPGLLPVVGTVSYQYAVRPRGTRTTGRL
jgi:hypothetical protein